MKKLIGILCGLLMMCNSFAQIDYSELSGLSNEVKSKFKLIRPTTLGQALRIDGITPAAVYILLSHVKKGHKKLKRA